MYMQPKQQTECGAKDQKFLKSIFSKQVPK